MCLLATGCASAKRTSSPAAFGQAKHIAKAAMARQLLTWIFYAMRDGEVRDLATATSRRAA